MSARFVARLRRYRGRGFQLTQPFPAGISCSAPMATALESKFRDVLRRPFLAAVASVLAGVSVLALVSGLAVLSAIAILAAVTGTTAVARAATQSLSELQERFDHEGNAVHKAKLMRKLGDAQFDALHAAEKTEDYNTVGVTLEKYRDNVRAALAGLKKEHPDAERQSNGYRELQMHVRRGIREVEEALLSSPEEFRPPLELVRQDLIAMDDELLRLLFPKRPGQKPDTKSEAKPGLEGVQP